MNINTELALRSIFDCDETISKERIEGAIRIINGQTPHVEKPLQVIRFTELVRLLGASRRSVTNYIHHGLLEPVYGLGTQRAYGVTMESYSRFILERSENRNPPTPEKTRKLLESLHAKASHKARIRERKLMKIRALLKLEPDANRQDKFEAVKRFLETTSEFSKALVCTAASLPVSTYNTYAGRPDGAWANMRKRAAVALTIIRTNFNAELDTVSVADAYRIVRSHGISTSLATIIRLLDENGFKRTKKESIND